jgi:uncharacterized Zn finger protein
LIRSNIYSGLAFLLMRGVVCAIFRLMKQILIFSLLLSLKTFSSSSMVRYEYVPVIKNLLIQKAIKNKSIENESAYDFIKKISNQAIRNIKHSEIPDELAECVSEIKFDLEQNNIYLTHQEIVESLVAAINS